MKNRIVIITALLISVVSYSQHKGHYLNFGGSVGVSGFQYNLENGSTKTNIGFGGKIGYSYFFHKHWGIATGIGFSTYSTEGTFDEYYLVFDNQRDNQNDIYNKIIILSDNQRNIQGWEKWTEIQKGTFFEIPLLLQYQTKFGNNKRNGIYFNIGAKAQLPLASEYNIKSGSQSYEGDYERWNVVLYDLPDHGFSVYNPRPTNEFTIKTSFAATAGIGVLFGLSELADLYLGIYCDYGLNNIKSSSNGAILYLDNDNEIEYRSMLESNSVDKIKTLSLGGEIGFRFKLGKNPNEFQKEQETKLKTKTDLEIARLNAEKEIEETKRVAEETRNKLEKEAEEAKQKVAEEAKRIAELEAEVKRMNDLMKQASEIKNAKVEKVLGEGNLEAIKVEFSSNILFEAGKSVLVKPSKEALQSIVQLLQENPNINIDIFGHTDNTGSVETNQRLSQLRAQAVADYLSLMKVPPSQIRGVLGKNFSEPIADNITTAGKAKNRRVEIFIYTNRK